MLGMLATIILILLEVGCIQDSCNEVETRTIVFVDSIGVADGDSNYVFRSIREVDFGVDGNIYVLDDINCCVKVYSFSGEFQREISARGHGPGEITYPISMATLGDGRVSICTPSQGGVQNFLANGDWEGLSAMFSNNPPMGMVGVDGNGYIANCFTVELQDNELVAKCTIGRYEEDSEPTVIYAQHEFKLDPSNLTEVLNNTVYKYVYYASRSGHVYVAEHTTHNYTVEIYRRDGTLVGKIESDVDPALKTQLEMDDEKVVVEAWMRSIGISGVEVEYNPEQYRWTVASIGTDSNGMIWIQRGTETRVVFDVFNLAGDIQFTAALKDSYQENEEYEFVVCDAGIVAYSLNPADYPRIWICNVIE
jgi:hypothetical protein